MNRDVVVDLLGWTGAIAVLVAYALVSIRKLEGDSIPYQLLNVMGAGLLLLNSFYYGAFPSVGVNIIWIAIAVFAVSRRIGTNRQD